MNPALTSGVSTGTTLALAWKLLQESQPPVPFNCPAPFAEPALDWRAAALGLVVGLLIGVLLGPVFEALVSFRLWVFQQTLERLVGAQRLPSRPTFRIC